MIDGLYYIPYEYYMGMMYILWLCFVFILVWG